MNNILTFEEFEVQIIYVPRLKHTYLRVHADSSVVIKTASKSENFILSFLKEKHLWIQKQVLKNQKYLQPKVNLEDEVLLFGDIYSIDSPKALYLRNRLTKIKTTTNDKINVAYNDFYKTEAKEYLTPRVKLFSQIMKLDYSSLKFRKMKSRWGSCSSRKEITLNTELLKLKKELIDYVIVHELSHLVHMNHSKEFHAFVEKYLPNSKELRKDLKNIRLLD
jgi:predicted metal-dependent hydrolase